MNAPEIPDTSAPPLLPEHRAALPPHHVPGALAALTCQVFHPLDTQRRAGREAGTRVWVVGHWDYNTAGWVVEVLDAEEPEYLPALTFLVSPKHLGPVEP